LIDFDGEHFIQALLLLSTAQRTPDNAGVTRDHEHRNKHYEIFHNGLLSTIKNGRLPLRMPEAFPNDDEVKSRHCCRGEDDWVVHNSSFVQKA
jgi:hypothetical protein